MDACVPLSSSFAALTCGWTKEWQLLVDLDPSQEEQCVCVCTCVVKGDSGDVISSHMDGSFSVPQVSELITNIPSELMFEGIITWISFVWEYMFSLFYL